MTDIRPKGAWYAVYVNEEPHHKLTVVDLTKLAECLPHGSGIDSDWTIKVKRNGDVTVYGSYHQVNESGYNGWRDFRFSLVRCTKNEYIELKGPMEGKFQVTRKRGTVYLESFTGGGKDNQDYLYDVVSCALADEMGIYSITSDVVGYLEAAQNLK